MKRLGRIKAKTDALLHQDNFRFGSTINARQVIAARLAR